ncbi:hypothetical protein [Ideonella sp.]|uniref:hypothetical protein n=1 Tax=Ideonella sp. TaxID=1929293 RepID=UPI0035ADFAA7
MGPSDSPLSTWAALAGRWGLRAGRVLLAGARFEPPDGGGTGAGTGAEAADTAAALVADAVELGDLAVQGGLPLTTACADWTLAPLATLAGTLHARITDAHWLFDADVTVPVRDGAVDFDDVAVAHVGPDSRMGVSRLGIYVDAPNGRTYLFQFEQPTLAGVQLEQRSSLLGAWVADRGRLALQPFAESLLRQTARLRAGHGPTEQARQLLGRTALRGDLQLGDGELGGPGLRLRLTGRGEGHNAVGLQAQAVGQGLSVTLAHLRAADLALDLPGARLSATALHGRLSARVHLAADGAPQVSLQAAELRLEGVVLTPR